MRKLLAHRAALVLGLLGFIPRAEAQSAAGAPDAAPHKDLGTGIRPFLGVTLSGGHALAANVTGERFGGAGFFALRGGIFWGLDEIALDVSPFTDLYFLPNSACSRCFDTGPPLGFQAGASYGHMTRLYRSDTLLADTVSLFWPARVGLGLVADTQGNVFFNGHVDVVGLAIGYGHVVVDLLLPSLRFAEVAGNYVGSPTALLTALYGVDLSYVF